MAGKKRIRSPYCTNCGKVLQPHDNYCPNCGQENDNKRQSFGKVMYELLEGFISIDSRLAHSLPALLFRPGFLTKEYLKGRRQRYLDPVKMLLSILVIYFILASFGEFTFVSEKANPVSDTLKTATKTADTVIVIDGGPLNIYQTEGTVKETLPETIIEESDELELDDPHYKRIQTMVKSGMTDTREIMDSLQIENTAWNRFYYSEVIKFAGADFNDFREFLISKMPWIIFVLMPVFALLLKLLYIRRDFLYIDHLIFAFHLHSFLFIMGICYLLAEKLANIDLSSWLLFAILIYTLLSFKNFYLQSWLKTIPKLFLLWFMYASTAIVFSVISLVVIFLIY